MVIFDGYTVEDIRAVGMADSQMSVNMCIGWHGTFMDVSTFAGLAVGNEDARRILTFDGMTVLKAATLDTIKEEINALIMSNHEAAKAKVRSDQPARAKQSAASKEKAKADPPTSRQQWSSEDWGRWNGGYHGRTWYSAEHDAVQDLCTIISANYTRHKSTAKATRKGMPVSFECYSVRLSAHAHGQRVFLHSG